MFLGFDVLLELGLGSKGTNSSAKASAVDEVDDTDLDLLPQSLVETVSISE